MSVAENVAYPLETRGHTQAQIRERVAEVLRLVDLPGLEDRPATDLSGGQQQRVAVARAIVAEADVLLLDEPLSNVDTRLRAQMRDDLRMLQQRLRVTTLYVTHDQEEALGLSDVVAVMDAGRIVEVGAPSDLYLRPRHKFTASFIGQTNLLPARVVHSNGTSARAETSLGPLAFRAESVPSGAHVDVCVRPEDLEVVDGDQPVADGDLIVVGTVTRATFLGCFVDCRVQVGEAGLHLRVHPRQMPRVSEVVRVRIPAACCYAVAE
jgi:iron(III) transport system ATP-binding protein